MSINYTSTTSVEKEREGTRDFLSRAECHFVQTIPINGMKIAQFTTDLRNKTIISYWGL